jgi:release factor glutamine methyltransferase
MATVEALLAEAIGRLRAAGSETARLDAEVLLGHVLGIDRTGVIAHPEAPVGDGSALRFREALERREAGEPVAYIRGVKEFHGLAFAADRRALIPRPETERLVDLAEREVVHRLTDAPRAEGAPRLRILDVGTGSGAIAITLATLLARKRMLDEVEIVATDISAEALELARENAVGHALGERIAFEQADLAPGSAAERWDLLLANLPYVRSGVMPSLPAATTFEPSLALDGGPDGLDVIGRLLDLLPVVLADDGIALLEIGADQGQDIATAVGTHLPGWSCTVETDLGGLPRVARIRQGDAPS